MQRFVKNKNVLNILLLLAFLIITLVCYYPILNSGALWDDWFFIFKSRTLRFVDPHEFWEFGKNQRSWPLFFTVISYLYKQWGESFFNYHLANVILHAFNGYILYHVLIKLKGRHAFLISLLYLVHPLNFYTVTWIIQLKTLMCIFFFLIALNLFLIHLENNLKVHYWLSVIAFGLSVMSKAAFAPIAILLIFYDRKSKILPFFIICFYSTVLTLWGLHLKDYVKDIKFSSYFISSATAETNMSIVPKANFTPRKMGPPLKLDEDPLRGVALSFNNLARYTLYTVYPWDNLLIHPPTQVNYSYRELIVSIFITLLFIFLLYYFWKEKDYISMAGMAFFLVSLIPLCGVLYASIYYYTNFVEYWLSVPVLGLLVCISRLKLNAKKVQAVLLVTVLMFFSRTLYSSLEMSDSVKMIEKSMEKSPSNSLIKLILANHYVMEKNYEKSNQLLRELSTRKDIDKEKMEEEIIRNLKLKSGEISELFTN